MLARHRLRGHKGLTMTERPGRERILNVPAVIVALVAIFGIVHAVFSLLLTERQTNEALLLFAFIPARYDVNLPLGESWPGGLGADIWTFVTYALIHGDLNHLAFNAVWLLAFGSPVARRFGTWRFLLFFAVTAAGGAAAHLASHFGQLLPMIGASAAISGAMAAAMRFAFQRNGPLAMWRGEPGSYFVPAQPLKECLNDPRILAFLLVWFGVNALMGLGTFALPGMEHAIAWQAHIGGFVVGLLAFALFDPVRQVSASGHSDNLEPPVDR
jgi:membrane associated rhomboid family serine protease